MSWTAIYPYQSCHQLSVQSLPLERHKMKKQEEVKVFGGHLGPEPGQHVGRAVEHPLVGLGVGSSLATWWTYDIISSRVVRSLWWRGTWTHYKGIFYYMFHCVNHYFHYIFHYVPAAVEVLSMLRPAHGQTEFMKST